MAFNFRKSKKFGLFRIGISKGGLSVSTGVKGLRVGANSKGTYRTLSIPGTGIYSTQYAKKEKAPVESQSARTRTPSQPVDMKKVLRVVLYIILSPFIILLSPVLLLIWLIWKVKNGQKSEEK